MTVTFGLECDTEYGLSLIVTVTFKVPILGTEFIIGVIWYLNGMILESSTHFEIKLLHLSWIHLLVTHSASQLLTNNWHLSDIFNTLSSIMFIREYACFATNDSKKWKKIKLFGFLRTHFSIRSHLNNDVISIL